MTQYDSKENRIDMSDLPDGSAYERTKMCCQRLVKNGMNVPSWMGIREYIGKGSSTDISRGIKDFWAEHSALLQSMEALPAGIPSRLSAPIQALWKEALDEASAVFDQERSALKERTETAEKFAATAHHERESLSNELTLQHEKCSVLAAALEQERQRSSSERAAREQAEKMAQSYIQSLEDQRESMAKTVEENTKELKALRDSLEDERRRSLLQVEQARQQVQLARQEVYRECEQKAAKTEAALRKEMADQNLEHFYLQKRHSELKSESAKLQEQLSQATEKTSPLISQRRKRAVGYHFRKKQEKSVRRRILKNR